ncbi:MAG: ATP-dependent DNA helicase RecG [Pseudomonadales bacterium]|jgi:ATP-dependent DNA helicase RecG
MPTEQTSIAQVPVSELKGVGKALTEKLAKIHIHSLQDILFHLPARYEDRTRVCPIGHIRLGDHVLIQAEVVSCEVVFGRRRALRIVVKDGSGQIALRFFRFGANLKQQLIPGTTLQAWGEARRGASSLEMYHPEMKIVAEGEPMPPLADRLTAVYPTTEGLPQARMRSLADQALERLGSLDVDQLLPKSMTRSRGLPSLSEALQLIHKPTPDVSTQDLAEGGHPAIQRLVIEELIAHRLSMLKLRTEYRREGALVLPRPSELETSFLSQLSFKLTNAQARVVNEISKDLSKPEAMLRLVQGDVGSGKTVVAVISALHAVAQGSQAVVMAPTEILAEQHYFSFKEWLESLGVKVVWLAGKIGAKQRRETLVQIADGTANLIVGTHAVFQPDVAYHQLALAVIDEQHRFGVDQRLALRQRGIESGCAPHQLIMTATPIPRTLAMTAYADLDCSVIDELPPGRTPIQTLLVSNQRREEVVERVHAACSGGQQAYWVCTLIDESEAVEAEAAEETCQLLQAALPSLSIGLVHGRMKAAEKAQVMADFKAKQHHLLVATTVIEVGVDVPNASVMIIENPERLGLSQLHQLRGRVGRGTRESFCILMYSTPLSQNGKARLGVMRESTDGFVIAEKDLELRGAGELLGTRQTGDASFKVAHLERDSHHLDDVAELTEQFLQQYPERAQPLIDRWLAGAEVFANA